MLLVYVSEEPRLHTDIDIEYLESIMPGGNIRWRRRSSWKQHPYRSLCYTPACECLGRSTTHFQSEI